MILSLRGKSFENQLPWGMQGGKHWPFFSTDFGSFFTILKEQRLAKNFYRMS